jgi:hypothetical protein
MRQADKTRSSNAPIFRYQTFGDLMMREYKRSRSSYARPRGAHRRNAGRMNTGLFLTLSMGLAALAFTSGCGFSLAHTIAQSSPGVLHGGISPFRVDPSASIVVYTGDDSPRQGDAQGLRSEISRMLETRYGRRGTTPARFRLRVEVEYHYWPAIACIDLQILGCPTGYTNARASLDLQVGDKLFVGHGRGTGYGGFYYGRLTGIESALGEAIGSAISNLFPTTWPGT